MYYDIIYIPGGLKVGRILRFNSGTEKWEEVGSFKKYGFAMQAGSNIYFLGRKYFGRLFYT